MAKKNKNVLKGKKAWKETIRPSHDKAERKLQSKYPNHLVVSTTGMPDFIISTKKDRMVELKPNRLARNQRASYERMYLSSTQESKTKLLISKGMRVGIMYYNKIGRKMVYSNVIWLSSKNLKSFCCSTPSQKRFDPDTLKFDQEKLSN
tara:strand:- start:40 stop:486 length:447 start_codon:yes stop_codon:yes gene_type:complete